MDGDISSASAEETAATSASSSFAPCSIPVECITCQVRLTIKQHLDDDHNQVWTLQALNLYGQPTRVVPTLRFGPHLPPHLPPHDEFYIVYHTHEHAIKGNRPLAIALCESMSRNDSTGGTDGGTDGSTTVPPYRLEWVSSPMNSSTVTRGKAGHVSIHFGYTAGLASVPPPYKQSWRHGASTQTCYLHTNVVAPRVRTFVPPPPLHLQRHYDTILAVGDSILEQLVASMSFPAMECTKMAMPLLPNTVPLFLDALDALWNLHTSAVSNPRRIALVLNSALWDVLSDEATLAPLSDAAGDPWSSHVTALHDYLERVLERYSSAWTVYWLLPTAVHIQRVHVCDSDAMLKAPQKLNRTRYLSASRTGDLYRRQVQTVGPLLARQTVSHGSNDTNHSHPSNYCLDVYEATYLSADWTLPGDGRHYRPELNQRMLSWFL